MGEEKTKTFMFKVPADRTDMIEEIGKLATKLRQMQQREV